ncbi:ABC transporter permease [Adhaeribacter pallidiroseus]|uniref:Macrolide export ATP-binding/permease protein MacB n=1 Tax=Adhaeribacter pallidiroseus TaxID=2072847 RepID=A0A369QP09_9BACT|nr:ABC transporter permease [Adhaeribacter pallidiroseus]RDC65415.1 Macrolide export ATP-binding/permease protein MacB [Adhaeribacter pallidiroseus]
MLTNYLKIALRNLLRHKGFSFINISGLALGMTCSILIMLWVQDERSFNQFHAQLNRLYRVMEVQHYGGNSDFTFDATPGPLGENLPQDIPEVAQAVTLHPGFNLLFTHENQALKQNGTYAGPDFFRMFSFPFTQGNPQTALKQPKSIAISETMAQTYFRSTNVVGKTIKVNNKDTYQITGVFKDVPKNSSLQFDWVMPFTDYVQENDWVKDWDNNGPKTYVLLQPNTSQATVDQKIKHYLATKKKESTIDLFLQPVGDMYLQGNFKSSNVPVGGRIEYVRLFAIVAVFILVIACINFMNLATARSARRAKEVGVRKVIGAGQRELIGQFSGESMLITLLAIVFALGLAQLLIPVFNQLTDKAIAIPYQDPQFILAVASIALITGLLSGSYPALFLASFEPVKVLKGTLRFNTSTIWFRKGLVVFQFILSSVLIVSALVVYSQVQYIRTKNLGLNRDNVAYVYLEGKLKEQAAPLRNDLLRSPDIKQATIANQNPLMVGSSTGNVQWAGKTPKADVLFSVLATQYDYLKTMDIPLKAGRDFSKEFGTDTSNFVINEEAARLMNMRDPIGQKIQVMGVTGQIIGVTKDFHSSSMHTAMQPLILILNPKYAADYLFVRLATGKTKDGLAQMEKLVKQYNPGYPFEYHFLDEDFEQMYKSEAMIGQLAYYFAFLAIFISCLGLFGLALFTAEQRTKEISIRKVLGASVFNITRMLSLDFLKLVLLANIIAWPLAAYVMHNWLQNFEYRTNLAWWIFALAGGSTLIIALLTVSYHAIRTAVTNPVTSLRSE